MKDSIRGFYTTPGAEVQQGRLLKLKFVRRTALPFQGGHGGHAVTEIFLNSQAKKWKIKR